MAWPKHVVVKEVGPRDGLQNEPTFVATADKVSFVNQLSACGFAFIEVSSFVHPKWIPALADAAEVLAAIERKPGIQYSALVPNEKGLERALSARVDAVNVFMSASESHNQKNVNHPISETYRILAPVIEGAKEAGLPVRGYVSTVFGCPYEGRIDVRQVVSVCERLYLLGVDELSLGDTIGVAVPTMITDVVCAVANSVPIERIALHLHDTRGTALANVLAGLQAGVTIFDASAGGLGGCPYAPGASGNLPTDDLLYCLHEMGIDTGIDVDRLSQVTKWLEDTLGHPLPSHARSVQRAREGGS